MEQLIQRWTFGDGDGPHLLITGGVHGDEFEPMAAARNLLLRFRNGRIAEADLRGRVTLAPCVNEPAFLFGSRCAEDKLDLARTCPGDTRGSITRRIAHELSRLIESADFYIDLHTGGSEFCIQPFAGYTLHPDLAIRETQKRMAIAFGLPIVWATSANLDGRSLSVARDARVPAIYAEYLGGASFSERGTCDYEQGCRNVMQEVGVLHRHETEDTAPHPSGILVEDARPGAGHMQVRHPSPLTGIFQPTVQLGQFVEEKQTLGRAYSLVDDSEADILADSAGMVLVLRSFPRVVAGESVGVVLDDSSALKFGDQA